MKGQGNKMTRRHPRNAFTGGGAPTAVSFHREGRVAGSVKKRGGDMGEREKWAESKKSCTETI